MRLTVEVSQTKNFPIISSEKVDVSRYLLGCVLSGRPVSVDLVEEID